MGSHGIVSLRGAPPRFLRHQISNTGSTCCRVFGTPSGVGNIKGTTAYLLKAKDPPRDVAPHRQAHPRAVELDRRHEAAIQPTPGGVARRTTRFAPNHARSVRRNRVGGRWPTAVRRCGIHLFYPDSGATHSGRFSRWIGMNESPRAPDCISSSCTGGRPRRRRPRRPAGGWRRLPFEFF